MILNQIAERQNEPHQIKLLRAQRCIYDQAKAVVAWQIGLTVAVPFVGALLALAFPAIKAEVALVSLAISILDIAFLDRLQKRLVLRAARVQEEFDHIVLELPWNRFVSTTMVEREAIHEAATALEGDDNPFIDWYPRVVSQAPIHLARIICQRTNLWYDSKVRRRYGGALIGAAVVLFVSLLLLGMIGGLTIVDFVLLVVAPATPFFSWAVREFYRQYDVAKALDRVREEAESLWERAKIKECGEDDCLMQSREFQNAIFIRRSTSTPIFNWIYKRMRSKNEEQMNVGANELVKDLAGHK